MALELRQDLRLTQQLVMTPQLQLAIKLLQLSRLELADMIQDEMQQNPALEEGEDPGTEAGTAEAQAQETPAQAPESPADPEIQSQEKALEDMDWANYIEEYNTPGQVVHQTEDKEAPKYESFISRTESLSEHLLWQVMLRFSDDGERAIGEMIAGNVNKDGYLKASVEELADSCQAPVDKVEKVLSEMQQFDPLGVCARDLPECLLIQARHLDLEGSLITEMLTKHMNHLQNKNYKAIASAMRVSKNEVIAAVRVIMELEPKPGRGFSDEQPHYITPDIYVYKVGDEYEIVLNDDGLPKLHVSGIYKNALKTGDGLSTETKDYVKGKLRSAAWLIRSIHQRQRTIYRVMESIVSKQRDFFDKGVAHLKPMVLRDVAEDVGMHESTISRVTTNKYAHTPQGVFELKYFFNSSISRVHGDAIASASVKEKILRIIRTENPAKPFSDDKIAALLEKENIKIARRTVAKYREMLGILPSSKRKKVL